MVGRGFFDNIWDPYSVAYAYPRTRYHRPRADRYEVSVDRPIEQPLNKKTVKRVKTIPVTDGGAPDMKPVAKSKDTAATEIQAFYRGYVVRKTQPLQHLKLIEKVKGELESLKVKSQEAEQKMKLRSDSKERLRWTEGVMALLLRLDSLQGLHPEVRLIRKAVTKELIGFQETIDSMSSVLAESNDVISQETIGSSAAPAPEVVEEMEIEDNSSRGEVQDLASGGASENASDGLSFKTNEDLISEKHVPHAPLASNDHVIDSVAHCDENGLLVNETLVEVGGPGASEALPEGSLDAENKEQLLMMSPTHDMEEGEVEPESSQSLPPAIDNQEAEMDMSQSGMNGDNPTVLEEKETTGMDGYIIPARISTQSMALEPQYEQDDKQDNMNAVSMEPECDQDDKQDNMNAVSMEPQCEQDGKQDNMNGLSDRSLLLQVLEENRKLNDVLRKVLERGKQQTDVIHNLTHRIAQLEEHQPPSKLLPWKDRKRVRPLEKGRRNRRHRGYVDSEDWPSVESDDYF